MTRNMTDGSSRDGRGGFAPGIRERCLAVPTATWSDALDVSGIGGVLEGIERRSGTCRVVGFAVTIREDIAPYGTYTVDDFALGEILDHAGIGDVICAQVGQADRISTLGSLAARRALARGVQGAIIDGGCRDIEDLRDLGFMVASRYVTPRSGKGRLRVAAVNEPIECGGVEITPGSTIVADETGIVSIPASRLLEILEIAEGLEQKDAAFAESLEAGASFGQTLSSLGHL
jgi:regulator of RNase E activity RraA